MRSYVIPRPDFFGQVLRGKKLTACEIVSWELCRIFLYSVFVAHACYLFTLNAGYRLSELDSDQPPIEVLILKLRVPPNF